jgi:uncharacterized protein (TIGR03382 family)
MHSFRSRPRLASFAASLLGIALLAPSGARAQARQVKDIAPGAASALGGAYVWAGPLGGALLFAANDGSSGLEPWLSDGTEAGTHIVADIAPGSASSSPGAADFATGRAVVLGGTAYFHARSTADGFWRTDGSAAGTMLVSGRPGGYGQGAELDGAVIFAGGQDGATSLWRSTGSDSSTQVIAGFYGVHGTLTLGPSKALVAGTSGYGYQALVCNGQPAGCTILNRDLYNVVVSSGANAVLGDNALFIGGGTLWKTDGTVAGTTQLSSVVVFPRASATGEAFAKAGARAFFAGSGSAGAGLWTSDGTVANTAFVKGFAPTPTQIVGLGQSAFFVAEPVSSTELWASDGTPSGTRKVAGPFRSIDWLYALGETLYMSADDGVHGTELWASDGTSAGTQLVADIREGSASSSPSMLTGAGGRLYFAADDGRTGRELWVYELPNDGGTSDAGARDGGLDDAGAGPDAAADDAAAPAPSEDDAGVADAGALELDAGAGGTVGSAVEAGITAPISSARDAGVALPAAPGDAAASSDAQLPGGGSTSARSSGCAAASNAQGASWPWLSLLLSLVVRRRRARR